MLTIARGVQAPFFDAVPSLPFNCGFSLSLYERTIMDKMFWATTMIAMLLLHLGTLYSPCQAHHKLLGNPFNSTQVIALFVPISPSIFFLQICQLQRWCFGGELVALEFLQGEETGGSRFLGIVGNLGPRASG